MTTTTRIRTIAALLALSLLTAACAGAASESDATASGSASPTAAASDAASAPPSPTPSTTASATTTTADFPVTLDTTAGQVTISERPESIVSLSPTATEMLFAVGAGDQVAAVDDQSDYPATAPTTDLTGLEPNVEAIVAYEPDLVVVQSDAGTPDGLSASLGELDVPVLVAPAVATVEEAADQIRLVGEATGHAEEADAVATEMVDDIEELAASLPDVEQTQTVYHELDPTYFSLTSDTFVGDVYRQLGAVSIADEAGDETEYPQLSAEFILDADPDLIVLADTRCCGVTPEDVADRDGWSTIAAVEEGNVISVDDDVASRWGPRLVEFAEQVAEGLAQAAGE